MMKKYFFTETLLTFLLAFGVAIGVVMAIIKPGGVYEYPPDTPPSAAKVQQSTYAASAIREMTVEGLRLGLTEDVAIKILKAHHWAGYWHPFQSPQLDYPFRRNDESLYALRTP